LHVVALDHGRLAIGRDDPVGVVLDDERLSRHHAEITLAGDRWVVTDLDSRNGTFLEGSPVEGSRDGRDGAVVRTGSTILLLAADVRPFAGARVERRGDVVKGPRFGAVLEAAAGACTTGAALLVLGESGTGKEVVSRAFHAVLPGGAPLVAVNCATIPEGVAERLLFGAKRGAYSGAMGDVDGHVQAADGGVLFLDEIGELEPAVQAKLLRVLETKEVTPLGGTVAKRVNVRFCAATNRDLRAEVAAGRFRADLYFRLSEVELRIPALRERREEIPWLVAATLSRAREGESFEAHPKLVEACIVRPWPGNVRELARELRQAAQRAGAERVVRVEHLRPEAGAALAPGAAVAQESEPPPARGELSRSEVEQALGRANGNISAAARDLGMHRTQLRRIMGKLGLSTGRA
jgi:DNA-binding NtrC family response regulator